VNNSAGEFGAILTHPEHRNADDNFSGCYERYASTSALVKKAMEFDPTLISGRSIFERLKEPEIQAIVDAWIDEISYGLASLIHIFNPPAVILGGGVLGQNYILDRLNQVLYTTIMESFHDVKLVGTALGNKAGLYGAIYNALSGS
jgi:predicted NBD/HSP70 family sugar kinase